MINRSYSESFWYFDERGFIRERLGWGDDGKGDSVGRNAFAYICWPNDPELKRSILSCVRQRDDTYVQCYRYPDWGADTMSRDHVGAIILALYINRDYEELDFILNNLPWRLSRRYTQTIDFWLWQRMLSCRNDWKGKVFGNSFLLLTLVQFLFIVPWNRLIRTIVGAQSIDPLTFEYKLPSKWKRWLYKTTYPQFALFLAAWQVRVAAKSWLRWIVQKVMLFESANIVIDAVLGKKIVDRSTYSPTTSFIWSRRLDNFDDILLRPMADAESKWNDLNRGMLDYLYFGIDRLMLDYPAEIARSIKQKNQIITY